MKILFVAFCAPRPRNPTFGNFVHHMAKALSAAGHQTDILVPVRIFPNEQLFSAMADPRLWTRLPGDFRRWVNHWRDAKQTVVMDGVRYIYRRFTTLPSVSRSGGNAASFVAGNARWLDALVKQEAYTHIVGHFLETIPLVVSLKHKVKGAAVYVHEDVDEYFRLVPPPRILNELPQGMPFFANSRRTCQQVLGGVGRVDASPAYLGIDHHSQAFQHIQTSERPLCNPVNVTCVSRFTTNKNQEVLVRLAAKWRQQSSKPPIRVNLVGDDGAYRRKLEDLVGKDGLKGSVVFRDAQNHDVIAQALREADVFIFPSRRESFGLVLLEAAAAGVPVIAGRNIGACEDLRRMGWETPLFDEESAESLEQSLTEILYNYPNVKNRAVQLQSFVRQNFTWANTARTIVERLESGGSI